MRNNSWVALIIVFGIIAIALFSSANVSFTTISTPNGSSPEATTGDTLVLVEGTGITITGDATTDEITIAATGGVLLIDDPGGTTFTSDSESGMELVSGELSLLRGCTNGQVVKWDSTTEDWNCSADSTGGSPTFDAIASGTNTTATMSVAAGAEIIITAGGHVEASQTLNAIHNDTGATLFECTAVFISSFNVVADLPEASIADADATNAAMGIVHADIADGADGFAVVVGSISGLDTTNVESWAVGDVLFLNTNGVSTDTECGNTLTNVRPTGAGTGVEKMAIVERVHATNGKLKVISNGAYDQAPNLSDDNVFLGSATAVPTETAVPDCVANSIDRLQYNTATNAFTCGTSLVVTADIFNGTILPVDLDDGADTPIDEDCLTYESTGPVFEWQTCGGAGGNAFETIDVPTGTDPVATSSTDTLTLTSPLGTVDITGSTTNVIGFDVLTAPAFSANPADCAADTKADAIAANGDLTCSSVDTGDILNDTVGFLDIDQSNTLAGNPALGADEAFFGVGGVIFESNTADTFEGLLTTFTDLTADRTWTLPNTNGRLLTTGDNGSVTSTIIADNAVNFPDIDYTNTLAGNPAFTTNECFWGGDGLSGGFICEGSTADANEQLYLFPDVNGTDTATVIVTNTVDVTAVDGRSLSVAAGTLDADAELYTDTHTLWIEDPTAADDFQTIWTAVTNSYTITAITCESDQTVTFDLQIDDGTPAAVNGTDIVCTTYATDSSLAGDTGLDAGERLDLAITSVTGTPTFVSISWTVTKND